MQNLNNIVEIPKVSLLYRNTFYKNLIFLDIFINLFNKPIFESDIEKKIVDVYNSKYIHKLYYTVNNAPVYVPH